MTSLRHSLALLALPLALALGCSAESKAKSSLEKYETAFRICKEETEKAKMKAGEHRCALVTSMAVEMSLKDSGLEESKWRGMLDKWLDDKGYKPYFIPPEKREKRHR